MANREWVEFIASEAGNRRIMLYLILKNRSSPMDGHEWTLIPSKLEIQSSLSRSTGRICRLAVEAIAAAKGLAALPNVTFEKGRARTPLRAGAGTANRQMHPDLQ